MAFRGSCLCGAVRFTVEGRLGHSSVCHCSQCRKQSGHAFAAVGTEWDWLSLTGDIRWFAASPAAQRGFCSHCGALLFWRGAGRSSVAIALGAFDDPTGIMAEEHIHTADKGDYYDLGDDGLPRS